MSEEMKKEATPVVPAETKQPETPETRVKEKLQKEAERVTEYKKDIKFLWLYGSVFCLVVLILIGASYLIQRKINAEVDGYKLSAETAELSNSQNQSRLSNISDENKHLKEQNEILKSEKKTLEAIIATDDDLITAGEQIVLELQKMLEVGRLVRANQLAKAKEIFDTIDRSMLPESTIESYTYYEERLQ